MGFAASRFTRPKPFMEMIEERILPDLLILDIVVPEMDAIKIIYWMEKLNFYSHNFSVWIR